MKSRRFYEKMGFESFGEEFLEAGIKHINMKLKIHQNNPPTAENIKKAVDFLTTKKRH